MALQTEIKNDVLSWDLFLEGARKRNNNMPQTSTLDNRLIFDTKSFFVIAGLGAFVEGYYLIISKKLYTSFAAITEEELKEYNLILDILKSSINKTYNREAVCFEHGMCACAGGLDHAHVHVMPAPNNLDLDNFKLMVNKTLKKRAAGITKIEFNNSEFDNVHDISSIINFNKNYKITEGKLLKFEDLKNFEGNFGSIRDKLLLKPQYIYFKCLNKEFYFNTSHYLGTQFGRELVYEIFYSLDKENKEKFYQLNLSSPTRLVWRWQDYMFDNNILSTMEKLKNYLKLNLNDEIKSKTKLNLFIN